jgi:signal transduction histidine kinase
MSSEDSAPPLRGRPDMCRGETRPSPNDVPSPNTSIPASSRSVLPLIVTGLIGSVAALIGFAVAGNVAALLGQSSFISAGRWTPVHLAAAAAAFVLIGVLGVILRRQFAQMRALSEELRRREEQFRAFAELGSDWLWETDAAHRFRRVIGPKLGEAPVPTVIGKTRLEMVAEGRILGDLQSPEWRRHAADLKLRLPFRNFSYPIRTERGDVATISVTGVPMFDERGEFTGYRGVARDITAVQRTERELREAKETAEMANRAKSEFLASMSHELRTPLNAVLGFSEIMSAETFGPLGHAKYVEYVRDIHRSGTHLLALINDVLDMSKIEAGRFELDESVVSLGEVVESCLAMVKWRAEKHGVVLGDRPLRGLPHVVADERAVRQVLLNLLTNAVKFTPRNGRVNVEGHADAAGNILVTIADTGVGIAPEALARIFEPFQQGTAHVARQQEGTGLGLAISRKLMEMHGGTLVIESQIGEGTVVTARFPAARVISMPDLVKLV